MQEFAKAAPYLQDPLVLVGFFLLFFFSLLRAIVKQGIFPQLNQRGATSILKMMLSYGFIVGVLIVLLGFGLKYKGISEEEQRRAVSLILSELQENMYVIEELEKNTTTLSNTSEIISSILRDSRFKVMSGLFPAENYIQNTRSENLPNLYNERMDWLESSGLLDDNEEMRRFNAVCAAITRTVEKTESTLLSLSDQDGKRYVIGNDAWKANLPIIRKISMVDITAIGRTYSKMGEIRALYNRVSSIVPEYNGSVKSFCASPRPERAELGATLAAERITFALLSEYKGKINALLHEVQETTSALDKI